jgi:hypothetical protein
MRFRMRTACWLNVLDAIVGCIVWFETAATGTRDRPVTFRQSVNAAPMCEWLGRVGGSGGRWQRLTGFLDSSQMGAQATCKRYPRKP